MGASAWLLYYAGFLFLTLLTAIISNFKNKLIPFAYITIIISLAVPLMNLIFSTGNTGEATGVSYLLQEFQARNPWAVIITFMYIYLAGWLVLFIFVLFGKRFKKWYHFIIDKGKELWRIVSKKVKESRKQKSVTKENEMEKK